MSFLIWENKNLFCCHFFYNARHNDSIVYTSGPFLLLSTFLLEKYPTIQNLP